MDFSRVVQPLQELYEHKMFPMIWLFGFVGITAFSNDVWWLIPGVGGFFYWVKVRWIDNR